MLLNLDLRPFGLLFFPTEFTVSHLRGWFFTKHAKLLPASAVVAPFISNSRSPDSLPPVPPLPPLSSCLSLVFVFVPRPRPRLSISLLDCSLVDNRRLHNSCSEIFRLLRFLLCLVPTYLLISFPTCTVASRFFVVSIREERKRKKSTFNIR